MSVKVYTTPTCSYCTVAKKYLRDRNVKFREYDVSKDENKYNEMVRRSRQNGVPVIDFDGKVLVGFQKPELERLIHQRKRA